MERSAACRSPIRARRRAQADDVLHHVEVRRVRPQGRRRRLKVGEPSAVAEPLGGVSEHVPHDGVEVHDERVGVIADEREGGGLSGDEVGRVEALPGRAQSQLRERDREQRAAGGVALPDPLAGDSIAPVRLREREGAVDVELHLIDAQTVVVVGLDGQAGDVRSVADVPQVEVVGDVRPRDEIHLGGVDPRAVERGQADLDVIRGRRGLRRGRGDDLELHALGVGRVQSVGGRTSLRRWVATEPIDSSRPGARCGPCVAPRRSAISGDNDGVSALQPASAPRSESALQVDQRSRHAACSSPTAGIATRPFSTTPSSLSGSQRYTAIAPSG